MKPMLKPVLWPYGFKTFSRVVGKNPEAVQQYRWFTNKEARDAALERFCKAYQVKPDGRKVKRKDAE